MSSSLDSLALSTATHLARLRSGVRLCFFTAAPGVLWAGLSLVVGSVVGGSTIMAIGVFAGIAAAIGPVLAAVGHFRFTEPQQAAFFEGQQLPQASPGARRGLVRGLAASYASLTALTVVVPMLFDSGLGRHADLIMYSLAIVTGTAWMSRNAVGCRHLAALATRCGDARLGKQFRSMSFFGVGLAAGGVLLLASLVLLNPVAFGLSSTPHRAPTWISLPTYVVYIGCLGLSFLWLIAWPIQLWRLERRLTRILGIVRGNSGIVLCPLPVRGTEAAIGDAPRSLLQPGTTFNTPL